MDVNWSKQIKLWVLEHAGKHNMINVIKFVLKDKSTLEHLCQTHAESSKALVDGQPTYLFLLLLEKLKESLQSFKPPAGSNSFSWDEEALNLIIDVLDATYQQKHFVDFFTFTRLLKTFQCMVVFRALYECSCETVVRALNVNLPRWTPKFKEKWMQMYGTGSEAYADFMQKNITESRKFVLKLLINAEAKKKYIFTHYGADVMKMVKKSLPLLEVVISAIRCLVGPTTIERFLSYKDEDFSSSNDPAVQIILEYVKPEMTEKDLFELLEILEPSESQMDSISISFGSPFPVMDEQLLPVPYVNNCGTQEENALKFNVLDEDMPPDTSADFPLTDNDKTLSEATLNIANKQQYGLLGLGPPSARNPKAEEPSESGLIYNVLDEDMPPDTGDDFPLTDNHKTPPEATLNIENKQYCPLCIGPPSARKPASKELSETGLIYNVLDEDMPSDVSEDFPLTDTDKTPSEATLNFQKLKKTRGNKQQYGLLGLGPPSARNPKAKEPSESGLIYNVLDEDMPPDTGDDFPLTDNHKTPPEATLNIENKQYSPVGFSPPSAGKPVAEEPSESGLEFSVLDEDMPPDTGGDFPPTGSDKIPPEATLNTENKECGPLGFSPPSAGIPRVEEPPESGLKFSVIDEDMPPDIGGDFPHTEYDKTSAEAINFENKHDPLDFSPPSAGKPEAKEPSESGLKFSFLDEDMPPDTGDDFPPTDNHKTPPEATLNIENKQYSPVGFSSPSAGKPVAEEPSESGLEFSVLNEDMPPDTGGDFPPTVNHKTPPGATLNTENKECGPLDFSPPSAGIPQVEVPSESGLKFSVLDEDMPPDTGGDFPHTDNDKTPAEAINIKNKHDPLDFSLSCEGKPEAEDPSESGLKFSVLDEDMPPDTSGDFPPTNIDKTPPVVTLNTESKECGSLGLSPSAGMPPAEEPSESGLEFSVLDEDMPPDTSGDFPPTVNHKKPPEATLNAENKECGPLGFSPPSAGIPQVEEPSESGLKFSVLDEDTPPDTGGDFSPTDNHKTPPEATVNIENEQSDPVDPPSAREPEAEKPSKSDLEFNILNETMPPDTNDFPCADNDVTPPEAALTIKNKQCSPPCARNTPIEEPSEIQAASEQMDLIMECEDGTAVNL